MPLPERCFACGSPRLQPRRATPADDGTRHLELRCLECFASAHAGSDKRELIALDRAQAEARGRLVDAYESSVRENMGALAACFGRALELDLIAADDFAPRKPIQR